MLHGCSAEVVAPLPEDDAEEEACELSISDAEGAIHRTNPNPNPDPDLNPNQARSTARTLTLTLTLTRTLTLARRDLQHEP